MSTLKELYLRDLLSRYVDRWPGRGSGEDGALIEEVKAARLRQSPEKRVYLQRQLHTSGAIAQWERQAQAAEDREDREDDY